MSLMQLLAVGKSIIGLSAGRSPYRMRQENLLPKFGPAKGAKAKPLAPPEAAPSIPKNAPKPEEPKTSQAATETKGNEMSAVVAGTETGSETGSEPGNTKRSAETVYPLGRWTRLNPFHARFSKQPDAAPVQGELLLETVQVMRNDLSDPDLEVVSSGQNSAIRAGNAKRESAAYSESNGLVLGRMTARLFGAGRT